MNGNRAVHTTREQVWLSFFLRWGGAVMLLAFVAVFMPSEWMAASHRTMGMGALPSDPILEYLTRTISALYGMHGGLLVIFGTDVKRYIPAIRYTGLMNVVFGVLVLGVDLWAGMPKLWTLVEGPAIIVTGLVFFALAQAGGEASRLSARSAGRLARRSSDAQDGDRQSRWEEIYAVVRQIPNGRVATYGQVAALSGYPRHARQVGYALHALPERSDVPWHRVINARGEVSLRSEPGYEHYQRHLLEEEGVVFHSSGRLDLRIWRWEPADDGDGEESGG